jgi:hypothetical protein
MGMGGVEVLFLAVNLDNTARFPGFLRLPEVKLPGAGRGRGALRKAGRRLCPI